MSTRNVQASRVVRRIGYTGRSLYNRLRHGSFEPLKKVAHRPHSSTRRELYNSYHQAQAYRYTTSYGAQFLDLVCRHYRFASVLDAGCGGGIVVRSLLHRGYLARGIELSDWVVKRECPDLLDMGIVHIGSLDKLPYKDSSFDLVFSSDVLEHIPVASVSTVASELVRVCRHHLFLSINLRPSSDNNAHHLTLRPREWWENVFAEAGATKNGPLVAHLQKTKPGATNREILEAGPAQSIVHEMDKFLQEEPYSFHGELEPWIFAFAVRKA